MAKKMDRAENLASAIRMLEDHPGSAKAWIAHSWALFYLDRMQEAVDSADAAIKIAPQEAAAWEARAAALFGVSNHFCGVGAPPSRAEAIASIDRAIALDPTEPTYYWRRGVYWFASGRAAEALESADAALAIDPLHGGALSIRAMSLLNLGRKEEAIAAARQAIEIRPAYQWMGLDWTLWQDQDQYEN